MSISFVKKHKNRISQNFTEFHAAFVVFTVFNEISREFHIDKFSENMFNEMLG